VDVDLRPKRRLRDLLLQKIVLEVRDRLLKLACITPPIPATGKRIQRHRRASGQRAAGQQQHRTESTQHFGSPSAVKSSDGLFLFQKPFRLYFDGEITVKCGSGSQKTSERQAGGNKRETSGSCRWPHALRQLQCSPIIRRNSASTFFAV